MARDIADALWVSSVSFHSKRHAAVTESVATINNVASLAIQHFTVEDCTKLREELITSVSYFIYIER